MVAVPRKGTEAARQAKRKLPKPPAYSPAKRPSKGGTPRKNTRASEAAKRKLPTPPAYSKDWKGTAKPAARAKPAAKAPVRQAAKKTVKAAKKAVKAAAKTVKQAAKKSGLKLTRPLSQRARDSQLGAGRKRK